MSVINTNSQALAAARNLTENQEILGRSLNRLSSGSKIVTPADDSAGLAVSEKLSAQDRRATAAATNVQNAISLVQTSDGFMSGMSEILTRMSELAIMASDNTKNSDDLALYQKEFEGLQQQLRDTIGGTTAEIGGTADVSSPIGSYNGVELFGPNPAGTTIRIGDTVSQTMTIPGSNLRQGSMLSLIQQDATGAFTTSVQSSGLVATVTSGLQEVAENRAAIGGAQSRLELAGRTLQIEHENLSSAISRIRDVDVAEETTHLAQYNILVEAGTAMLSQANQSPRTVLSLLQSS